MNIETGINDIRLFHKKDGRFLKEFPSAIRVNQRRKASMKAKATLTWLKQHLAFDRSFARVIVSGVALLAFSCLPRAGAAPLKTENVVLIICDGLRWQEVFTGAEELLVSQRIGGVGNVTSLRKNFWRETPEARREALLPFIWTNIALHGQIFGNQLKGSTVKVTNGRNVSYPGYNEILTGFADPRIRGNEKILNPNPTVFEWLNGRPRFRDRVAVFGTWDVFPYIFNVERSHLPIWPAWETRFAHFEITPPQHIAGLRSDTTPSREDLILDSFLLPTTLDYLKSKKPRLAFIAFCETDEWSHFSRYDLYLTAAHHMDDFVRRLWETVQSMPQYRGKTTFIITADHGRGTGPTDWKSHGGTIAGSEDDWIAVLGPDTPPLGERTQTPPVTQNQIAATIAALLGEDYHAAVPQSGFPIGDIFTGHEATKTSSPAVN